MLSTLLLIYLLFSSRSCNNQEEFEAAREQKQLETSIDSISSAFSSDKLSSETLRAFEETARQRFADFVDYLAILSDTVAAPAFKENTRRMIRELFISDQCVLRFTSTNNDLAKEIPLSVLLDPQSDFVKHLKVFQPDTIRIMNALQYVNDSLYTGKLGVTFRVPFTVVEKNSYHFSAGTIEFLAAKREKSFGKDKLKVWSLLLGE